MTTQARIFRQAAVDRLSSPDQLDQLIVVADARGWLVTATLGVLLGALVGWGFAGTIPTNVPGQGILIASEGRVVAAMSPAAGRIEGLLVGLGDTVQEGQPVARLLQDDVRARLDSAHDLLAERAAEVARLEAAHAREVEISRTNLTQRRTALDQSVAAAAEQMEWLGERLRGHQELASQGFATRAQVQTIQAELAKAEQAAADGRTALLQLQSEQNDMLLRHDRDLAGAQAAVAEVQRSIRELQTTLARDTQVTAPVAGWVTELRVGPGDMVAAGQGILGIESTGFGLQAVTYVPTRHGKMIEPGMTVRIAPDNVRREEYGTLTGVVRSVSQFPSTREGMTAVLRNDTLVQSFSKDGAPYEVRVDVIEGDTPSGYAWSSRQGPPLTLRSGTTLASDITVREQAPVSLIIPLLRKATGLDR